MLGPLIRHAHAHPESRASTLRTLRKAAAGGLLVSYYAGETFTLEPFTGKATVSTKVHGVWEGTIRSEGRSKLTNSRSDMPDITVTVKAKGNKIVIETTMPGLPLRNEPSRLGPESTASWTLALK